MKQIVLIPVHNEVKSIASVVDALLEHFHGTILLVDDGSQDGSVEGLVDSVRSRIEVVRHERNLGYGASLISGFSYALQRGYDQVVTMDCDWQHEPSLVPQFFEVLSECDIVSGSRYLIQMPPDTYVPPERRRVNFEITAKICSETGLCITDAFCGFKGYRREVLQRLSCTEQGYAFPLQVWAQIVHFHFKVKEIPVPLIYPDPTRQFGGGIDDAEVRKRYYLEVWERERLKLGSQCGSRSCF
ncbi:MAG: glycosyltransferase family 2 protein [Bdellovibrionales bacterium]|nr:glycosyltransferase family 2 protein [Bdellovibrionales bacterium]